MRSDQAAAAVKRSSAIDALEDRMNRYCKGRPWSSGKPPMPSVVALGLWAIMCVTATAQTPEEPTVRIPHDLPPALTLAFRPNSRLVVLLGKVEILQCQDGTQVDLGLVASHPDDHSEIGSGWWGDTVQSVSSEATFFARTAKGGGVLVWRLSAGKLDPLPFLNIEERVTSMALANGWGVLIRGVPNDDASGQQTETVVWDLLSGRRENCWTFSQNPPKQVVVAGARLGFYLLFQDGTAALQPKVGSAVSMPIKIPAATISAIQEADDGRATIAGTTDGWIWRIDTTTGQTLWQVHPHRDVVTALATDDQHIISCSRDGTVVVSDLARGWEVCRLNRPRNSYPTAVAVGMNGNLVAVGTRGGELEIWSGIGHCLHFAVQSGQGVTPVVIDGCDQASRLMLGCYWDDGGYRELSSLDDPSKDAWSWLADWSPLVPSRMPVKQRSSCGALERLRATDVNGGQGCRWAAIYDDGTLDMGSTESPGLVVSRKPVHFDGGHYGNLAWHPNADDLFVTPCSQPLLIYHFPNADLRILSPVKGYWVAPACGDRFLVCGSESGGLAVYRASDGKIEKEIKSENDGPDDDAFRFGGQVPGRPEQVYACSISGHLAVVDVLTGRIIRETQLKHEVLTCEIDRRGASIAISYLEKGVIDLYNVGSLERLWRKIHADDRCSTTLLFLLKDRVLAGLALESQDVRFWRTEDGKTLGRLRPFRSGDWIFETPDHRFQWTAGLARHLYWKIGGETHERLPLDFNTGDEEGTRLPLEEAPAGTNLPNLVEEVLGCLGR